MDPLPGMVGFVVALIAYCARMERLKHSPGYNFTSSVVIGLIAFVIVAGLIGKNSY